MRRRREGPNAPSPQSANSYENHQIRNNHYQYAGASRHIGWQPRLPPGLHHKAELAYECGA